MAETLHIGNYINQYLKNNGHTVAWLARQMNCERKKLYRIFNNSYIDTEILFSISHILKHDFFVLYSQSLAQ
ncbi:MAG: XRE family transcriptional regulator [Prevotellaceae bacterium]|nr:XRE family transcriptional regulator [Prevotellaceae bacterium]